MSQTHDDRPSNYYEAYIIEEDGTHREQSEKRKAPSRGKRPKALLSAIAQIVIGVLLVLVGIPMLILPGPGLLTIAGGAALVAGGLKRFFNPSAQTGA